MNIYVGNLSYSLTEEDLKLAFSEYGEVISAKIVMDRDSGRSKGFGFVEMGDSQSGEKAIDALDGSLLKGRNLKVNQAKPR
jgi:RNA recognition motif-containing protein